MRPVRSIASITLLGLSALYACSSSPASDAGDEDASIPDAAAPSIDAQTVEEAGLVGDELPPGCADAGSDGEPPQDLLCTGLYANFETKTLAAGVTPYTPGYVLWSDGAKKNRWIRLPPGTTIDAKDMDEWTFPVGTKVWKEFRLDGKRIETRIFWKTGAAGEAWTFATYRWTDDQTSARRMDGGEGNVNGTTYEIPSRAQCKQCHGGRRDRLLGFDAVSLAAPGATGLTMAQLVASGRLAPPPTSTLVVPDDGTGRAAPAMGWLHANCGTSCHNGNPDALASGTGLRLRINVAQLAKGNAKTLDVYTTAVGVKALRSDLAGQGFLRIKAGNASLSALPFAAGNRVVGSFQMPPILSRVADTQNVQAIRDWIGAMPVPDGG